METYSINPNPMPQTPLSREEHHRLLNLSMIIVAAAVIVGLLYWWTASVNTPGSPAASNSNDLRTQVAAMLRSSPVHASQQEIESVAAQLANSNVTTSNAQKQAVAQALQGK